MKGISNYLIGLVVGILLLLGLFRTCRPIYDLEIKKTRHYENQEDNNNKYIFYKPNYFINLYNGNNHKEIVLYEISGEYLLHYFGGLWNTNKYRVFFASTCLDMFGIRYYENSKDIFDIDGHAIGCVIIDNKGHKIEYKRELKDFSDRIIFYKNGDFSMNEISGVTVNTILPDEQIDAII
jgi:hypothetical protein